MTLTRDLSGALEPEPDPRSVLLRGGVAVPLAVLQIALDLEARGVTIRAIGRSLIVEPQALLTPADEALVRRHRFDLGRLARYVDAEGWLT